MPAQTAASTLTQKVAPDCAVRFEFSQQPPFSHKSPAINKRMSSPSTTPMAELLSEKQKELDSLLNSIDESQDEFDSLFREAEELRQEVIDLKRDNEISEKVRRARDLVATRKGAPAPPSEDAQFPPEHFVFIKEKRNEIDVLRDQITTLQSQTNPLEAEVNALRQDAAALRYREMRYKKKLERKTSERKAVQHQLSLARDMLKETGFDVNAHKSIARDAELALTGLIGRRERIEGQLDRTGQQTLALKQLEGEVSLAEEKVSALEEDIAWYQEERLNYENQAKQEMEQNKAIANWEAEEKHLKGEWEKVKKELKEVDDELKKVLERVNEKEVRHRKLAPIVKKWKAEVRGSTEPVSEKTIDELLRKCNAGTRTSAKVDETKKSELEKLAIENTRLEQKIESTREWLMKEIRSFEKTQMRMKEDVQQRRTAAFEAEHSIVEQISMLKLKLAQKKRK